MSIHHQEKACPFLMRISALMLPAKWVSSLSGSQ
jgi:hypothetical protein